MKSSSLSASIILTLGAVLPASHAPAQQQTITTDPKTWPAVFDGTRAGGPYAWVDGATALKSDPKLANAVQGGQEGQIKLYICRATMPDGVHIGKQFNRICNVSWGGREITVSDLTKYQILVNTRPDLARFLPQQWVAPTGTGLIGGAVGNSGMRVCRATHTNGSVHPGKEWQVTAQQKQCLYGYGGRELGNARYQILSLSFDKTAWSKNAFTSQTTVTINAPQQNLQDAQIVVTGLPTNVGTPKIDFSTTNTQVTAGRVIGPYTHIQLHALGQQYYYTLTPVGGGSLGVVNKSLIPSKRTAQDVYTGGWLSMTFEKVGSSLRGFFGLRLLNTNQCLTVTTGYKMGGTVQLRPCNGSKSQSWVWVPSSGQANSTNDRLMSAIYPEAWDIQGDARASNMMNLFWGFDKSLNMCLKLVPQTNTITTGNCETDAAKVLIVDFPQMTISPTVKQGG